MARSFLSKFAEGSVNALGWLGEHRVKLEDADAAALRQRNLSLAMMKDEANYKSSPEYLEGQQKVREATTTGEVKANLSAAQTPEYSQLQDITLSNKVKENEAIQRAAHNLEMEFVPDKLKVHQLEADQDLQNTINETRTLAPLQQANAVAQALAIKQAEHKFTLDNLGTDAEAKINAEVNTLTNAALKVNPNIDIKEFKKAATLKIINESLTKEISVAEILALQNAATKQSEDLTEDDLKNFIASTGQQWNGEEAARQLYADGLVAKTLQIKQSMSPGTQASSMLNPEDTQSSELRFKQTVDNINNLSELNKLLDVSTGEAKAYVEDRIRRLTSPIQNNSSPSMLNPTIPFLNTNPTPKSGT